MDGNGMRKRYTIGCGIWGPVLSGIIKCVEAECGLALKKDAHLRFIE